MAEQATVEQGEGQAAGEVKTAEENTGAANGSATDGAKGNEGKENSSEDGKSLLGEKPKEATVEKVVPEKYEIKMPEGRELDADLLGKFTPILKELKLTNDEAQKLAGLLVEDQIAKEKAYQGITEGWKKDTIKILGNDYQAQLAIASKFIDKFGNDEVRKVLDDTGLGNHPEIVQLFIKAGKHFGNDNFVTGEPKQNAINDPERQARKLFNNTKY